MKITVGSQNPVKIKATKDAFQTIFKTETKSTELIFESIEVKISDLHNTPNTINDMIRGAEIRAQESLEKLKADLGVGIEGGLFTTEQGTFLTAYAVIKDLTYFGVGAGPAILLPKTWNLDTDKTFELGTYVDNLTGQTNTKQKNGAIGILTGDVLKRGDMLKLAVLCAYYSFKHSFG